MILPSSLINTVKCPLHPPTGRPLITGVTGTSILGNQDRRILVPASSSVAAILIQTKHQVNALSNVSLQSRSRTKPPQILGIG